jgi:hypothetical protein
MGTACSTYGRDEKYRSNLSRKPEDKRPLGKHRRGWEDIIMYFR